VLQARYRIALLSGAFLITSVIAVLIIHTFALFDHFYGVSSIFLIRVYAFLFVLSLAVIFSWMADSIIGIVIVSSFGMLYAGLFYLKSLNYFSLLFLPYFGILAGMCIYQIKIKQRILISTMLEVQRVEEERNVLGQRYEKTTKELEYELHKYADYANLRDVIDDFSSSLDQRIVSNLIVKHVVKMIAKGDVALLYIFDNETGALGLTVFRERPSVPHDSRKTYPLQGDLLDTWVVKNLKQLFVNDVSRDVRFDLQVDDYEKRIKSVISVPIVHDAKVIGVLRMNSGRADCFSVDDLRVLAIIGDVASAAMSNAILYKRTEELAIRDSLTGLYVQRYFKERLRHEHKRALIAGSTLGIIMCDIDNFKKYNDTYGHAAGDIALRYVAEKIKTMVGDAGICARYGGEEFVCLVPLYDKKQMCMLAQDVCEGVAKDDVILRGKKTEVTVSVGLALLPDHTLDAEELLRLADEQLYRAKRSGKNRVCVL